MTLLDVRAFEGEGILFPLFINKSVVSTVNKFKLFLSSHKKEGTGYFTSSSPWSLCVLNEDA